VFLGKFIDAHISESTVYLIMQQLIKSESVLSADRIAAVWNESEKELNILKGIGIFMFWINSCADGFLKTIIIVNWLR
jgi:hypothetical protein